MKRFPDERHTQTHENLPFTITDVFLDQKRVNVCKHTVKMAPHKNQKSATRVGARQEGGRRGGKIE